MRITITRDYLARLKALKLPQKGENNSYLVLRLYGDGIRASDKFNIKVYRNKEGRLKLVTNDYDTLKRLLNKGNARKRNPGRTILIDDSGIGFPLGGVLVGVYDTKAESVEIAEVEVDYFQQPLFAKKAYLQQYAFKVFELLTKLNVKKENTTINICSGYINTMTKELLREKGYNVEMKEIGEPLQSVLEKRHKQYIKERTGYQSYYDPKEVHKINSAFKRVIDWIKENPVERLKGAKTGWKYFKQEFCIKTI